MVSPKNGLIKLNSVGLQSNRKCKKKQASNESTPALMFFLVTLLGACAL